MGDENIYRKGLEKSRGTFWGRVKSVLGFGQTLEAADLETLEEILIGSDVGVICSEKIIQELEKAISSLPSPPAQEQLAQMLRKQIAALLPDSRGNQALETRPPEGSRPRVVLVVGVNGSGKTTTIGKLASRMARSGQKILVAGADTYRAAAIEQLRIWAERAGADFVGGIEGGDPASVVHDALTTAKAKGMDTVIIDTAGRLHTKVPLMKELEKIIRVAGKVMGEPPGDVLLVLDATTGQNALVQAKEFSRAAAVSGIILTKMDGTAKGGILIPLSGELGLPILYVGLGEGLGDLVPFEREEFAKGLVG